MVDSTLEMVANPYDTVAGLPEFIEHVPVTTSGGIGPNPLKLLRADNDEERARALDLRESLLDDWRFQTKQFEQDYNNGDYAEITGRVGFEGVMVVLPFLKALRGKPPLPEPPPIRPPPPLAHLPDPPLEPPTPHLPDPPPERPAPPPHEAPEHPPAKPPAEAPVLRSDPNKLQPAKRGDGFDLRDSMVENHDLIRGRPEATDLDSAARELATAEYAARNEHEVLMGKEADRAINKGMKDPNGNDLPSADVVAKLRNGNYRLYEAKGANGIGDAVEQLEHSGKQLGANSVESYTVACKPPINEPGYAVRNGELLLHGEPARIGGKPIQVIFVQ
jgi:hypothetical protein